MCIRDSVYDVMGDPTEVAVLVAAAKAGVTKEALLQQYTVIGENPFDAARKRMSVTVSGPGGVRLLCKMCIRDRTGGVPCRCPYNRRRCKYCISASLALPRTVPAWTSGSGSVSYTHLIKEFIGSVKNSLSF